MKRIAFPTLVSLAVSSLLACSGVSDPGANGNPGMTMDSGSTPDTSTPVVTGDETSTPPPTTDTGTPPVGVDAGVDATMPGPDAAPDTGTVGPVDTGTPPPPDAGMVDAGGDAGATFSCGAATTCAVGTETCCVQAAGGGGAGVTTTCQTGTTCPGAGATALHCTATADCTTGMDCCIVGGGGMGAAAATSMCRANCAAAQLCDPTAADPGCPPQAPTCMRPGANGAGAGVRLPATVGTCQ